MADYEVGYGKPPKHSRWAPGVSGNPKGRVKGQKGLKTDLAAELDAVQTIKINGKPMRGRRQQLVVMTLAARAAAGDLKAAQTLLPLIIQVLGIEDRGGNRKSLSAEDQAILAAALGDYGLSNDEPLEEEEQAVDAIDDEQPPIAAVDDELGEAGIDLDEEGDHDPI